jgi:hypothetical protein
MKILLLSHDLNLAKNWIRSQNKSIIVIDERELITLNPNKFRGGFENVMYSIKMVEEMRVKCMSWTSNRPLIMLMDMRHQTAVEKIAHDQSILFYDKSLSQRICYNPIYKTTHFVTNIEDKLLQNLLQQAG